MTGFLARRFLNYVVLCLVATFMAFSLASLTFDPLDKLQGRNPAPPAEVIEAKRAELRLDDPIPARFVAWAGDAVQGDFGRTVTNQSITDQLWRRVGVSLRLFLLGTTLGITVGVILGVAGAIRQYKPSDYFVTLSSFVILSAPVFLIGTLLKVGALQLNQGAETPLLY
ncbi:MAG: ABC transporter permease, partial [Pseudonocardiales bacterium]|nr:ABC transporter permease [Pseudonocardiales bacterium]